VSDLVFGQRRLFFEQFFGRHNQTRGAKATLKSSGVQECLLDRMQLLVGAQPFQGLDRFPRN